MINYLSIILLSLSFVFCQQTVTPNGFNAEDNNISHPQESWLKRNDRFVFVIVVSVLVLSILIWYVVRSIRSMRKRLVQDNQNQMVMIQGNNNFSEAMPVDNNGFHKMPDYSVPPTGQQHQHQHQHRY